MQTREETEPLVESTDGTLPDVVPCAIVRGGTSKGVFVRGSLLPGDESQQDSLFRRLMGSPDRRQVDGLGGADPLTSKVVVVYSSSRAACDVEYDTIQVGIADGVVTRGIMCGNLSAGVGYFAIAEGLVHAVHGVTDVRMYCRSNGKRVIARIPTPAGVPVSAGSFRMTGVPGTGAEVELDFRDPVGTVSERLQPLGRPIVDVAFPNGRRAPCSVIDAGALYAFLRASDCGAQGSEPPEELDRLSDLRSSVESARAQVAELVTASIGTVLGPSQIKCALVSPSGSDHVERATLVSRIVNQERTHKAYAVGGAICTAVAAMTAGTVVAEVSRPISGGGVIIAHPSGQIRVGIQRDSRDRVVSAKVSRTARVIMRGTAELGGKGGARWR